MVLERVSSVGLLGNTRYRTFVNYNGKIYCFSQSDSGESVVFPAKKEGGTYIISSFNEILDFKTCSDIADIAQRGRF
jgi:hypothetical protein